MGRMSQEKSAGTEGLPAPHKKLRDDAAKVTVPDGDITEPTDAGFEGEEWDESVDGALPEYSPDRIAAELEQAATTKDEEVA